MFDKKVLLQHMCNTNNYNKMTQAGVKTGFGVQSNMDVIKEKKNPEQPNYEVIKEADYV
tara:strand:+ start:389 stop:565 length:177 start_codon:yes stop_codon:yes gene_type:complete